MTRLQRFAMVATGSLVALAACSDTTAPPPCTTGGTGSLAVTVNGVPSGLSGAVRVTGPGGTFNLTATQTLPTLTGGTYRVTPAVIVGSDSLIRPAYAATVTPGTVCVRNGESAAATVAYALVPSSGRLWYGAGFYSLGFASSQLGTTATIAPAATVGTRGGAGVTFDKSGNLWVRGQSTGDPPLMRYAAGTLGTNGTPTPDRILSVAGLDCLGAGSLAFDAAGNLWMSLGCQGRVVRLTPAQYAASGTVTPSVQITGLTNPHGLAFDASGNLWVADGTHLRRYNASRLAANVTTAANLSVSFTTPTPPAPGVTTLNAFHLAFRANGELWVSSYAQRALYRAEPTVVSASGTLAATPTRILYLADGAQPKGFAFDDAGGLYIGTVQSSLARLAPAQLNANSTPSAPTVPQRTIASGAILGFGDDVATFPAAPGTPLYHRVP